MRKIFIAASLLAAMTFASCGNRNRQPDPNPQDTVTGFQVKEQQPVDTTADSLSTVLDKSLKAKDADAFQSAATAVKAKYDALIKAGLTDEAKAFAAKMKSYFTEHAAEVKTVVSDNATVNDLVNTVSNLETAAANAPEAVKEQAGKVKDKVKDDAIKAKEYMKKSADEKVDAAKKTINKKTQETRKKASDAVNKASEKASSAVNNALSRALGEE